MMRKPVLYLALVFALMFFLTACSAPNTGETLPGKGQEAAAGQDRTRFLTAVEDEPVMVVTSGSFGSAG